MEDNRVLSLEAGWRRDAMLPHGDKLLNTLMGRLIPMPQDLTFHASSVIKAGENKWEYLSGVR